MFNFNKIQSYLVFLFLSSAVFFLNSCGDNEDMDIGACENIEFIDNTLEFNGTSYNINEYNFSTLVGIDHNFSFKAFDESCIDSLDIFLKFSKAVSFPTFSLQGTYTTTFDSQTQVFDEMSGNFRLAGGARQSILSGGDARIVLVNDTTYQILIDAATAAFGSDGDVMQLDVTVPRE